MAFLKKVNPIIFILTLSDIFVWGIYLIASPLQAIYLSEHFGVDSVRFVTVGLSIYYLIRSVLQIPIGMFADKHKSDIDEVFLVAIGGGFIGLGFILFPFITNEFHFYFISFINGIGASFNLIGWRKLFAKNLDKNKEGMEYALYETVMSVCTAIFGLLSSWLSMFSKDFFQIFFFIVGIISISGSIFMTMLLLKKEKEIN